MSNKNVRKILIKETRELRDIISETPIEDFTRIGDFDKKHSIVNPVDRKLLSSPKAEVKIRKMWQNTEGKYNLVFINDPRVKSRDQNFAEVGEVPESFIRDKMKISKEELPINPSACTIIYTNNSGAERVMASGWILAHRLGHAIRKKNNARWESFEKNLVSIIKNMLNDVYGIKFGRQSTVEAKDETIMRLVAQQLGTMKSARESNLRSWYEFAYEVFAQYLITGNVRFNPLPDAIVTKLLPFGRKQTTKVFDPETQEMYNNHDLEYYTELLNSELGSVVENIQGKIFVM